MLNNLKQISLSTLILMVFMTFSQCAAAQKKLLPTNLRVTVIDGKGNFVEDATVSIYSTEEDYINNENVLKVDRTDGKGRVTFKKMGPQVYFIQVVKDELNNDGRGSQTSQLEEGKTNKVNVVIE